MKKILATLLLALLATGAAFAAKTTEKFDFKENFSTVTFTGFADITIVTDENRSGHLEITYENCEGYDKIIEANVSFGSLNINTGYREQTSDAGRKKGDKQKISIVLYVGSRLHTIVHNGIGDIRAKNFNASAAFTVKMKGIGDFTCEKIHALEFVLVSNGNGDFEAKSIQVNNFEVNANGNGDVEIKEVGAKKAKINCNGTADVEIAKLETGLLRVRNSGTGDIDIKDGSATEINAQNSGTGDIEISSFKAGKIEASNKSGVGELKINKTTY